MKMPATFLIIDGVAYYYRDFDYTVNMKRYIENKAYVNSTRSFP